MKLTDYIRGERHGKEARRIEREAMEDPFLADALEGFDTVEGDHADRIARMRRRVERRPRSIRLRRVYGGIAAALLLCLATGGYLLLRQAGRSVQTPLLSLAQDSSPVKIARSVPAPDPLREQRPAPETKESDRAADKPENARTIVQELSEAVPATEEAVSADEAETAAPEADGAFGRQEDAQETAEREPAFPEHDTESAGPAVIAPKTDVPALASRASQKTKSAAAPSAEESPGDTPFRLPAPEGPTVATARRGPAMSGHRKQDSARSIAVCRDTPAPFAVSAQKTADASAGVPTGTPPDQRPARAERPSAVDLPESGAVTSGTPVPAEGEKAYRRYLKKHNTYPVSSPDVPHGTVVLAFRVNASGRPAAIRVVRSVGGEADREAMRLVAEGPDWMPGAGEARIGIDF